MNPRGYGGPRDGELDPRVIKRMVGGVILVFAVIVNGYRNGDAAAADAMDAVAAALVRDL